jgi:hypothetical protein
VITHAINGFLLEYYPYVPKGKEKTETFKKKTADEIAKKRRNRNS